MILSQDTVCSSPKCMLTVTPVEKAGSIPTATFCVVLIHLSCGFGAPRLLAKTWAHAGEHEGSARKKKAVALKREVKSSCFWQARTFAKADSAA